jgi:hypothetical protein
MRTLPQPKALSNLKQKNTHLPWQASPRIQYLSLESRVLFDGAGLAAAEHQLAEQATDL